jgi:hypothetical protein
MNFRVMNGFNLIGNFHNIIVWTKEKFKLKRMVKILIFLGIFLPDFVFSQLRSDNPWSGVLHNGIKLPSEWPPRYVEPLLPEEMPVPYLKTKPACITTNLGRQLFVDDFLVSETNMKRIFHKPVYYASNPVLEPDKDWEKTNDGSPYAAPFSDGIWYDEKAQKFRMWYLAGAGLINKEKRSFYTCYAESADGKHWLKTKLDVLPETNVVDTCDRDAATVWLDKQETNPQKRFKMFIVERRTSDNRWQFVLKYSADGIHWSNGIAQSGDIYDRSTAFYNPFIDKWALSMRYNTPVSSRSRSYIENHDPELLVSLAHRIRKDAADKNIVYWFVPDDREPRHPKFPEINPGIYNFDAIAYESIILGLYSVWQGPENDKCEEMDIQKRNEISLGYSRDGFHFYRPTHDIFMGVNETTGAWNWGNVQSINGTPIIMGDSLYFYSSGRRLNKTMWDCYTSVGLATLRRDGFVSMSGGDKECYLTTEKIKFDGKYFLVNVETSGNLRVEIIDSNNKVIPGFTKEDCLPFSGNNTKQIMTWKRNNNLSSLIGKQVKIKFYLTKGDLYSFWISTRKTGESNGYTAGGGPGLNESGKDIY